MKLLSHLLRVGYFFVLIELINSYLLIAANLNDFRTIAEKLVPEDFVNRLSKVVSNSAFVEGSETSNESKDYEETDNLPENNKPDLKVKAFEKPNVSLDIKGMKVDFDELVERVRKRLEDELKNKYIVKKQNSKETTPEINEKEYALITDSKTDETTSNNYIKLTSPLPATVEELDYENLDYEETVSEKTRHVPEVIKFTTKDDRHEYADSMVESEAKDEKQVENKEKETEKIYYDYETVTENDLYKKVALVKKDSYEDYKIPEKENGYSISEKYKSKRFKIERRPKSTIKTEKNNKNYVSRATISTTSKEIRGVTQDLLNDYNDTEIITDDMVLDTNNQSFDKKLGTMIPKRELYSMITPNYVNKVPNVVEKYNFNEPIPVRDQEREVSKYYGNPPARVNKKVRLL